jgi:hypothetical protein
MPGKPAIAVGDHTLDLVVLDAGVRLAGFDRSDAAAENSFTSSALANDQTFTHNEPLRGRLRTTARYTRSWPARSS